MSARAPGYSGRTVIFEVMPISPLLKTNRAGRFDQEIREQA
jgi:type II secretory ATPase GspE/PulE/Tfp pilus assembly ATPase PilB-like protein